MSMIYKELNINLKLITYIVTVLKYGPDLFENKGTKSWPTILDRSGFCTSSDLLRLTIHLKIVGNYYHYKPTYQ